jgi:hypothetical protein
MIWREGYVNITVRLAVERSELTGHLIQKKLKEEEEKKEKEEEEKEKKENGTASCMSRVSLTNALRFISKIGSKENGEKYLSILQIVLGH